jgi:glycosyltransferase involved in cell wall biosynthesis
LKVLILSTSERKGGASVAANRLLSALRKDGIDASMLVRDKETENPNVVSIRTSWLNRKLNFLRFAWERLVIFLCSRLKKENLFKVSIANTGSDISHHLLVKDADIIHLHWINQGFLSLKDIRKLTQSGKPVVWTMHDMWPCTGICHYAWGCEGFKSTCGHCPFLFSKKRKDLSYIIFKKKQFLSQSNIHIVTVSSWLKNMATQSLITNGLNVSVIPNTIDVSVFFPLNKQDARNSYSFPQGKKIILMGAAKLDDPIKGFEYLKQALLLLKRKRDDLFLVLFGEIKGGDSFLSDMPVEYRSIGLLSEASLIAQLYACSDVTVVPSFYETFGQTLIESMACGCPVVSFDNSGQTDIIDHKVNGYLAKYQDAEDLAAGIEWVLDNTEKLHLSEVCIKKVQGNYTESIVARQYIDLYKGLTN